MVVDVCSEDVTHTSKLKGGDLKLRGPQRDRYLWHSVLFGLNSLGLVEKRAHVIRSLQTYKLARKALSTAPPGSELHKLAKNTLRLAENVARTDRHLLELFGLLPRWLREP